MIVRTLRYVHDHRPLLRSVPQMESVSKANIGPLMAYLVPGAVALWGVSPFVPAVGQLFKCTVSESPSLGGFLYLTVASFAAGMTVSAIRWLIVDTLHAKTGLNTPGWNFDRLGDRASAYALLIDIHYQHYLFYANGTIAIIIAYAGQQLSAGLVWTLDLIDGGVVLLVIVFIAASRDTLNKYYRRVEQLLSTPRSSRAKMSRADNSPS